MPAVLPKMLRSSVNIVVLFSALVVTPLLALSHFSMGLAGMLGDFADNYLPNSTLINAEKRSRAQADSKRREQRVNAARERSSKRQAAKAGNRIASDKGRRVLLRGAGAMMVGWVPVIGLTADVVSLSEDYSDICELFAIIDEMSGMLYLPEADLYGKNYCDAPERGLELINETARNSAFPWEEH